MYRPAETFVKCFGNGVDMLHICTSNLLFALVLIQLSFTGCYNETADDLVMPERFIVADGKFVGRNNEKPVIVIMVERERITVFTYQFKDAAGYQCSGGNLIGSAQEPVASISNNSFGILHGNNFEFSGKFVSNDSCSGTWNSKSSNNPCLADRVSGSWVATRN